jgi:hypothetical protein
VVVTFQCTNASEWEMLKFEKPPPLQPIHPDVAPELSGSFSGVFASFQIYGWFLNAWAAIAPKVLEIVRACTVTGGSRDEAVNVTLAGHSLGGAVAMVAALDCGLTCEPPSFTLAISYIQYFIVCIDSLRV